MLVVGLKFKECPEFKIKELEDEHIKFLDVEQAVFLEELGSTGELSLYLVYGVI